MPLTLTIDSVELAFGDRPILRDVFLQCMQGEVLGLLGRNGCGKSSLLKIIFGTLQPAHKYMSIDGAYIGCGFHGNRVAYLPQQNYLPAGIRVKSLARILVDPFLWEEFSMHEVYRNHLDKTIIQLSGGELRMLEMLMIVYNKADFILLDEPFTHISPVQTDYFKPIIQSCAKRKGVIITDHLYQNVLDIADRLIILDEGCTKTVQHIDDLAAYHYISGVKQT